MTISRPLESIICSAKNKSPARNCGHGKELQIHGVEDGLEAVTLTKVFFRAGIETIIG